MKNSVTFGQLYPTNSFIHKMDARVKLLLTIIYIMATIFADSYFSYVITAAVCLITIIVSKIPLHNAIKTVKPVIFIIILTALINLFTIREGEVLCSWWVFIITTGSIEFAVKMSLRLFLLVLGSTILTMTTSPMDLTDGIESLLKPLKVVKFPVEDVSIVISIALRYIPTLIDETDKIMMAQKARGSSIDEGNIFKRLKALVPVIVPLFVSAWRKSDELALALDARCYKSGDRTKLKVHKLSYRDLIAAIFIIGYFAIVLVDKYIWLGVF